MSCRVCLLELQCMPLELHGVSLELKGVPLELVDVPLELVAVPTGAASAACAPGADCVPMELQVCLWS